MCSGRYWTFQEKLFVEEGQIEQECENENEEDCEVQDNTECADEEDESNDEIQDMGSRDEEEYDADLVAKKFADASGKVAKKYSLLVGPGY